MAEARSLKAEMDTGPTAPRGPRTWSVALAAAALAVVAVTLGVVFLRPGGAPPAPVATEPVPTATPAPGSPAAISPPPSPSPGTAMVVFFARDQLPPVAAMIRTAAQGGSPEQRTIDRVQALLRARQSDIPPGTFNAVAITPAQAQVSVAARIQGEIATVELDATSAFPIRGAAQERAFIQQLVYTITEEPGIQRAFLRGKGGAPLRIDQTVIDKPLAREDVFGYAFARPTERIEAIETAIASALDSSLAVDTFSPGLARLRLRLTPTGNAPEGAWIPSFTAEIRPKPAGDPSAGKWLLRVFVEKGSDPRASASPRLDTLDLSPVRDMRVVAETAGTTYLIGLDDARPWRVAVRPMSPVQIFVDIGGHPDSVSPSVAVYLPRPGDATGRDIAVQGAARAFEANVQWRLRDADEKVVASGHTTATVGTSAVWGTFTASATIPPGVIGSVTLEVFWGSPKDGSDMGLVRIQLRLR